MNKALPLALCLAPLGCAGAEPITVVASAPQPAEVTVEARPAEKKPEARKEVEETSPPPTAAPSAAPKKADPKKPKAPADGPQQFGMIGLLGVDDGSAQGGVWGSATGDAMGFGGLGLSGAGAGGGGGQGVGLGSLGTVGRGAGTGSGFGRLGSGARDKPPQVKMGAVSVSGRLPPEVIQRIVRQNFGRFRLCYEKGLRVSPNLTGRITVKFVIAPDGAVERTSNGGSDLPDQTVVTCVVQSFQSLSFPQPEGGKVLVTYPIMFVPGGSASDPPPAQPPTPPAEKGKREETGAARRGE